MRNELLKGIIEKKQTEIQDLKRAMPLQTLFGLAEEALERTTISLCSSLKKSSNGIIAELNNQAIHNKNIPIENAYKNFINECISKQVAACSIKTDSKVHGGSIKNLKSIRKLTSLPIIEKNFILDSYQLFLSKAIGTDAIILLPSIISQEDCQMLSATAHTLGMEVFLEIQSEEELAYINQNIDLVGVCNYKPEYFNINKSQSLKLQDTLMNYLKGNKEYTPLLVSENEKFNKEAFDGIIINY